MSRVGAVVQRELRSAFRGPVAYAVTGLYLLIHGLFYTQLMEDYSSNSFSYLTMGQLPDQLNLVDMMQRALVISDAFLLLFLLPALTMRTLADERRQGTSDLLLSYPLREFEIVLAKFVASAIVLIGMLALGVLYPLSAALFGHVEIAILLSGLLGLLLFGMAVLAIGIFTSSLTENQVVAFGLCFVIVFGLTALSFWAPRVAVPFDAVLRYLSMTAHADPLGYGLLRGSDIYYFLAFIVFFLFLATGMLESRRWGSRR